MSGDPHRIRRGEDWYLARGIWYDEAAALMPDLSAWTATYTVWPNADPSQPAVIDLAVGSGITLGISGDLQATTTLASGAAEDASTVTLASATGVTTGDVIAVTLTDGDLFVTTITNLAGTVVTLAKPLPEAAASGNVVRVFSPEHAVTNVLLFLGHAATSALSPWGRGLYNLDLIDPFGHVLPLLAGLCILEEGRGHA
jgi:hypothetical protein